jgi:hypothetical protein
MRFMRGRLWGWASLLMGAQLGTSFGQPGAGSSAGDFEIWLKGALGVECLPLWELCKGNLEGGSLAGEPQEYVEKALEMGISLNRGSNWETWRRARIPGL